MDSIIFDVDGTLWDSTGIVAEAWSDYLIHTERQTTDGAFRPAAAGYRKGSFP